jgi:hypothetical protein
MENDMTEEMKDTVPSTLLTSTLLKDAEEGNLGDGVHNSQAIR